jgi:hypothetical protein
LIKNDIQRVGNVTWEDRQDLRDKYQSSRVALSERGVHYGVFHMVPSKRDHSLAPPDDEDTLVGVTTRLALVRPAFTGTALVFTLILIIQELGNIIEACVRDMQQNFRDGLEGSCLVGASKVGISALCQCCDPENPSAIGCQKCC